MYSRSFEKSPRRRQSGVALVVALLVFALSAALMVGLQRDFDLAYRRGANSFIAEQTWFYLLGAEELATLALVLDYETDQSREEPRDDLSEIWAQPANPYPLDEGGWLLGGMEDLQGRFNLNSLGGASTDREQGAASYTASQQFFIRLLQGLDGLEIDQFQAAAITEAVADWIDVDDQPRPNGAESGVYAGFSPSYRPGNGPMTSVSELRAINGITPEIYNALRSVVTVWPAEPVPMNIHTAPLSVLRAINVDGSLQPLSAADGEELLQYRQETGFSDIDDLFQQPVYSGGTFTAVTALLGQTTSYFLLTSQVEIADREQRLYSVLRRTQRQIDVLQRTNASLYDQPAAFIDDQLSQDANDQLQASAGSPL